MIKVKFYSLLRKLIGQNEIELELNSITVSELINQINEITKKNIYKELIHNNEIKPGTIILLNGRNIHHLKKLQTVVNQGDMIDIFPPGGGG